MAKGTLKRKEITLNFGELGTRKVLAVVVSKRMAVHLNIEASGENIGSAFVVSDPVTGFRWPYTHGSEASAVAWAQKATEALGDDPMPDAKVSNKDGGSWKKRPKRHQEIKEWLRKNPPQ